MTRNFNWFGAMALLKPGITIDRDQALPDMKTLDQLKLESMASNRLNSIMLAGFATVALLLSAIGIYGVISIRGGSADA
jgi:hypothetical protein